MPLKPDGTLICDCGNDPGNYGFTPCDINRNVIANDCAIKNGHRIFLCDRCGAILDADTGDYLAGIIYHDYANWDRP